MKISILILFILITIPVNAIVTSCLECFFPNAVGCTKLSDDVIICHCKELYTGEYCTLLKSDIEEEQEETIEEEEEITEEEEEITEEEEEITEEEKEEQEEEEIYDKDVMKSSSNIGYIVGGTVGGSSISILMYLLFRRPNKKYINHVGYNDGPIMRDAKD